MRYIIFLSRDREINISLSYFSYGHMIVYVRSFWIKRLCPRVQLRNGLAYIYFLLCMKLYNANGSAGPFIFPCLLRLSHGQTYYQNFIFPTPGNRRQWLLQIELHHSARQKDSILCHRNQGLWIFRLFHFFLFSRTERNDSRYSPIHLQSSQGEIFPPDTKSKLLIYH